MRKEFARLLLEEMRINPNIILITADLGYGLLDEIHDTFPDRFFNVGAAEQAMMGVAVGMALNGKIPICYTITPFYDRCYETIKLYLEHEKIPVKLVGSGRDKDYEHDGISHWETNTYKMVNLRPTSKNKLAILFHQFIQHDKPIFLSLKR